MKCVILALLFVLGIIPAALAEGQGGYAILLKSSTSPYWMNMAQGFKDAAEQMGIPYVFHVSDNETSPETQLNTCLAALDKKPEILMVAALTSTNLIPCLREAGKQNIQIVDLDINLDPKISEQEGVKVAFSIGSDNIKAGEQAAEYLVKSLMPVEVGDVLIVQRAANRPADIQRIRGFRDKLLLMLPKMRIAQTLTVAEESNLSANMIGNAVGRYPALVAIFATHDNLAVAASKAARARGKNIITIGIGGNKEARNSVYESKLSATVAQLPYLIGKQSVEFAHDLQQGLTPPPVVYAPTLLINDDVLNKKDNHLLRYVK